MTMTILENVGYFDQVICEEVSWMFGDWPEDEGIGSSDISICATEVLRRFYADPKEANDQEFYTVRRSVQCAISNIDYVRANY